MSNTTCWCGRGDLTVFGSGYLECACGTLVRSEPLTGEITRVADEEHDLYGRNYWFAHQAALGLPDLDERARSDLHTRQLQWLRLVTSYTAPPGRVLEIGAAHGGFLALLAMCGFDVTGTELSPWVVDYAKRQSGVRLLRGPLEQQRLKKGSFDLILLFDVLEHVQDPLATLTRCAQLLADDGVVIIQTPRRPPGSGAEIAGSPFRSMLIAEHLHLFSDQAARLLLQHSGLPHIVAEPPVFDTDMMLVAARRPPRRVEAIEPGPGAESSRVIATLLSLEEAMTRQQQALIRQQQAITREQQEAAARIATLEEMYRTADRDRLERLRQIQELSALFEQADRDRVERLRQIEALDAWYRAADTDRVERQRQIDELSQRYQEADRDRVERQRQIDELSSRYRAADRDRVERQRQIDALNDLYRQADRDRVERLERLGELELRYQQADEDRTSRLRAIQELEARLRKTDEDLLAQLRITGQLEAERDVLRERHQRLHAVADDHRNSRVYKALVRLGRWRGFDDRLRAALQQPAVAVESVYFEQRWTVPNASIAHGQGAVAVDVTAILPGGENGGAKLVALELIGAMARLAPDRRFLLLTSPASHQDLEGLEASNLERRPINNEPTALSALVEEEQIAVLFSPMTASRFDDPRVPVVCLIHDLQYVTYPEFFDETERRERAWALVHAIARADHVVTPSQFVRASVLQHSKLPESQVTAIPHGVNRHRLGKATSSAINQTLDRLNLTPGQYFLYPANFWPHKNHAMLLIAFGKLCRKRPDLDLKLVFTGDGRARQREVRDNVIRMRLADRVVLPGYLPDAELGALMAGALALVFPSLYEGYGLPVAEAFAAGCPVTCSNFTSLPEVAGDAAEYFDPRKPDEIAAALERLATCPNVRSNLQRRGEDRLRQLESWDDTALRYLSVIDNVTARPRRAHSDHLGGVYMDGWSSSGLVLAHLGGNAEVRLEFENAQPVEVTLEAAGVEPIRLEPQQMLSLRCAIPAAPGHIVINVRPTFRPADAAPSVDTRRLGVRVRKCHLHRSGSLPVDLIAALANA